jgi:hypothetical protein
MGKAMRMQMPQLTLADIIAIRGNSSLSLTTSPFGVTPEQYEKAPPIYVKSAVAWKGKPDAMPASVRAGLQRAIAISKQAAGVKGTTIYNGKVYPKKCIEQKKLARKM